MLHSSGGFARLRNGNGHVEEKPSPTRSEYASLRQTCNHRRSGRSHTFAPSKPEPIKKVGTMSQLSIFIDGTWLLNQLAAGGSFANATETPDRRFPFDFSKLNAALVEHVRAHRHPCTGVADCYISTSIFSSARRLRCVALTV